MAVRCGLVACAGAALDGRERAGGRRVGDQGRVRRQPRRGDAGPQRGRRRAQHAHSGRHRRRQNHEEPAGRHPPSLRGPLRPQGKLGRAP